MPVLELDRPKVKAEKILTDTEPVLQKALRILGIGGAHCENTITVIENPVVDGKIGYLFARRYLESRGSRRFEEIYHIRVELNNFKIWEHNEFDEVRIEPGFNAQRVRYDFLTADGRRNLPVPTKVPYEIRFLNPDLYDQHISEIRSLSNIEKNLGKLNSTLVEKARVYKIDPKTKGLLLPANYASLELIDIT